MGFVQDALASCQLVDVKKTLRDAKKVVIFGASNGGRYVMRDLDRLGVRVSYFCDNDERKWHSTFNGLPVIPPSDLAELNSPSNGLIICLGSFWAIDIATQLSGMSIKNYIDMTYLNVDDALMPSREILTNLDKVYDILEDETSKSAFIATVKYKLTHDPTELQMATYEKYFHPAVSPQKHDIILDGGAWHGDTVLRFAEVLDNECRIVAFEPDEANYAMLTKNVADKRLENVVIPVMSGLYDRDGLFAMDIVNDDTERNYIIEAEGAVSVLRIDDYAKKNHLYPNLIKMDIEGSEYKALVGGQQTIRSHRPKLQICVYHKSADLWEIPLLLHDYYEGNCQMYWGHHEPNGAETVLYVASM